MASKVSAFGLLPLLLITASVPLAHAQTPEKDILPLHKITNQAELDRTVTALDAAVFDAYNRCDLEKFGSLIDENIEFYHDKAGNTFGRAALVEAIKNNICGKVTRELVPGTLQVYPMKDYGALELGVHLSSPWPGTRCFGRGEFHSSLAVQGRGLEDHARDQL